MLSRTSIEVLSLLGNFEIDAGITYLDNEPLGRVTSVPLYSERYQLITAAGNALSERPTVTWAEISRLPLCLLTPDMQNRRIIDQHLAEAGAQVGPTLESNSMIVLFSHIRTGKWSSIMPLNLAQTFGFRRADPEIPIVEPDASHRSGWWPRRASRTRRWSRRCWTRRWRWQTICARAPRVSTCQARHTIEPFYQATDRLY